MRPESVRTAVLRPRWRTAALVLVAAGGLLAGAALFARDPVVLFVALPLLLAPVAALLEAPSTTSRAEVSWAATGSVDTVAIEGRISLGPGLAPAGVDVTFFRPEPLLERAPPRLRRDADGSLGFDLDWRAPYPCLATVPLPEVVWRDRLGLLERRVAVDGTGLAIERFPPELARLGSTRLRRTAPVPGEVRSKTVGGGGEFFALRASVPSDTPRQINWRATARAGRLVANDYLLERTGDLLLLLDLRPTPLGAARDRRLLAISAAAALGMATGFLGEKSRVGLGLFDEFLTAVPLGTGRLQRYRLHRALERAALAATPGPSERFAASLRRFFPPGVTTVLFSSLADDSTLVLLSHLRRRGYAPIVLSPSPLPLLAGAGREAPDDAALADRLLALVRRHQLGLAWQEAPVIDWPDYWSLVGFARFLERPMVAGRST